MKNDVVQENLEHPNDKENMIKNMNLNLNQNLNPSQNLTLNYQNNIEDEKEYIENIRKSECIYDQIQNIIKIGQWEIYTYEWLMNRRTCLYYNTLHGNYFFYNKSNQLILLCESTFYMYVCMYEHIEFISNLFFNHQKEKKLKIESVVKTMQGRRMKQEDRYLILQDLSSYFESTNYKSLYYYKKNPIQFYSIFDGHRGIKACEYCLNHMIKNIIFFLYGDGNIDHGVEPEIKQSNETNNENKNEKKIEKEKDTENKEDIKKEKEKDNDDNTDKQDLEIKEDTIELQDIKNVNTFEESSSLKKRKINDFEEKEVVSKTSEEHRSLNETVCNKIKFLDRMSNEEIIEKIKLSFKKTDDDFLRISKFPTHGCTVISLIIFKNKMFIANLGDSRAIGVTSLNNVLTVEPLSFDHKPKYPKERERIRSRGGDIICYQNVYRVKANANHNPQKTNTMDTYAMKNEVYLSVSRAIGDKDFKENEVISAIPDVICKTIYNFTEDQIKEQCKIPKVEEKESNEGDISKMVFYSQNELKYHFVILACDGVWDVLSNKHIIQILQMYKDDPNKACSEIIKTAFAYGSQDNITAMLLKFH